MRPGEPPELPQDTTVFKASSILAGSALDGTGPTDDASGSIGFLLSPDGSKMVNADGSLLFLGGAGLLDDGHISKDDLKAAVGDRRHALEGLAETRKQARTISATVEAADMVLQHWNHVVRMDPSSVGTLLLIATVVGLVVEKLIGPRSRRDEVLESGHTWPVERRPE